MLWSFKWTLDVTTDVTYQVQDICLSANGLRHFARRSEEMLGPLAPILEMHGSHRLRRQVVELLVYERSQGTYGNEVLEVECVSSVRARLEDQHENLYTAHETEARRCTCSRTS